MRFYFCTTSDKFGESMILYQRIHDTIDPENEDNKIKRICVSSSILGCLSAIGHTLSVRSKVNIYYCDVNDMNKIYQPTIKNVSDVEYTGEFWLLEKQKFNFLKSIYINYRKHFYVKNSKLYSIKFEEL